MGLFRVDLTQVDTLDEGRSNSNHHRMDAEDLVGYEVELEANSSTIVKYVLNDKDDDKLTNMTNNKVPSTEGNLKTFVGAFLRNAKGLAAYINGSDGRDSLGENDSFKTDVTEMGWTEEECQVYRQKLAPVIPIVGDYLLRAVAMNIDDGEKNDANINQMSADQY